MVINMVENNSNEDTKKEQEKTNEEVLSDETSKMTTISTKKMKNLKL